MERRRHFLRLTGENFSPVNREILRKYTSLISLHKLHGFKKRERFFLEILKSAFLERTWHNQLN